ncbi:MAG: phosphoribosyl-AMP cyclohydrolase [Deltaproteobacteria bacterium]|nr:MAG: phosphoribosyl-AMP cyclohydrolase [Deltaproteobacteria bacterium]
MEVKLDFSKLGGLIPAVVQDYETGEVLMVAFMNEEAWRKTLETGKATYWSRSRRELWTKGATSGNFQEVKEIYIDCDNDTVLLKVIQHGGAACHTGYRSCFFRRLEGEELKVVGERVFVPEEAKE